MQKFGALTMEVQLISGVWIFGGQEHREELIRFIVDTERSSDTEAFFSRFKATLKDCFAKSIFGSLLNPSGLFSHNKRRGVTIKGQDLYLASGPI